MAHNEGETQPDLATTVNGLRESARSFQEFKRQWDRKTQWVRSFQSQLAEILRGGEPEATPSNPAVDTKPSKPPILDQAGTGAEKLRRTAGPNGKQQSEPLIAELLAMVAPGADRVMLVAQDPSRCAEDKMIELERDDCRFRGYDSVQWAALLGVKPAAIRKTKTWINWQKEKR